MLETILFSVSSSKLLVNSSKKIISDFLYMALAHEKLVSGKKEYLWESIQNYYKASAIYPSKGEPFYFIGQAYLKIGDKDFDLIIESYDRALSLNLDSELRVSVVNAKNETIRRKDLLKNFWK